MPSQSEADRILRDHRAVLDEMDTVRTGSDRSGSKAFDVEASTDARRLGPHKSRLARDAEERRKE